METLGHSVCREMTVEVFKSTPRLRIQNKRRLREDGKRDAASVPEFHPDFSKQHSNKLQNEGERLKCEERSSLSWPKERMRREID